MRCEEAQELLTEYAEDSLEEFTRRRLENHMSDCDACWSEYELLTESSKWMETAKQQYTSVTATRSIVDVVMARILSEEQWAIPIGKKVFTLTARMRRIGLSVAMVLLMFSSFTVYNHSGDDMNGILPYTATAESFTSESMKAEVGSAELFVREDDRVASEESVPLATISSTPLVEIASDAATGETKPNHSLILGFFGILITIITMSWITRV